MLSVTLEDRRGLYRLFRSRNIPRIGMRENISDLGVSLARHTRQLIGRDFPNANRILCVVILRGGALLYPGFLAEFRDADFCFMGLKRADGGAGEVHCAYCSEVENVTYDLGIYVDCIAATGGTLMAATRFLQDRCRLSRCVTALICSTDVATRTILRERMGIVAFSLAESLKGNVVAPDFGELDAGDLFTSARRVSFDDRSDARDDSDPFDLAAAGSQGSDRV